MGDASMTDEQPDVEDVRRRLEEIQSRKRGGIRWDISQHTAELAIGAIEAIEAVRAGPRQTRRSGKSRRRKRNKRLL
jgi:hypothetical protein